MTWRHRVLPRYHTGADKSSLGPMIRLSLFLTVLPEAQGLDPRGGAHMGTTQAVTTPKSTRDLRAFRRRATAFCLVGAPVTMLAVSVLIPSESDQANTYYQAFLAHPGQAQAEMAAGIAAFLLSPFLVLGLYRLSARRAPVLAGIGAVLSLLGWAALSVMVTTDALIYELARHRMGPQAWDLLANHDVFVHLFVNIFVAGHIFGMALLAFALWRSRAVPSWVAGTLLAGDIGHVISHGAQSRPLDVIAFGLFLLAGAAAARIVLGTTDDRWDQLPISAGIDTAMPQDSRATAVTIG